MVVELFQQPLNSSIWTKISAINRNKQPLKSGQFWEYLIKVLFSSICLLTFHQTLKPTEPPIKPQTGIQYNSKKILENRQSQLGVRFDDAINALVDKTASIHMICIELEENRQWHVDIFC